MYEVLILLVLVNLGFTSDIWRTVRRGPKRKFLGKLPNGKPITPNHTPSSLRNGIELRITDEDRRFFSDFEMFADALNRRFEPNEPFMADTQFKNLVVTNSCSRPMSVVGTTADNICSVRVFRILTRFGHAYRVRTALANCYLEQLRM
jgi:hypothetical protein